MGKICIETIDETMFKVTVEEATTTTHTVTVSPEYHQKITGGRITPQDLVVRSFEFLLRREPNTAIYERFDLRLIGRFFPEYERTMRETLE